jgi:glycopeptide antibiotics resistance protein
LKTIKQYILNHDSYNTEIWVKNLFGNIVMFVPLGVIIPILNKRYLKTAYFIGLIVSILIVVESVQMLTRVGSFDVDDIILNTLGAMIGLICTNIFIHEYFKPYLKVDSRGDGII